MRRDGSSSPRRLPIYERQLVLREQNIFRLALKSLSEPFKHGVFDKSAHVRRVPQYGARGL